MNATTYAMNKTFQVFRQSLEGNMDYAVVKQYSEIVHTEDFLKVLEALLNIGVIDFRPNDDNNNQYTWFLN
jgi:hypothetical protein